MSVKKKAALTLYRAAQKTARCISDINSLQHRFRKAEICVKRIACSRKIDAAFESIQVHIPLQN